MARNVAPPGNRPKTCLSHTQLLSPVHIATRKPVDLHCGIAREGKRDTSPQRDAPILEGMEQHDEARIVAIAAAFFLWSVRQAPRLETRKPHHRTTCAFAPVEARQSEARGSDRSHAQD